MNIKCPKCGEVFSLTDSDYLDILKQVKDKEFEKELKNREELFLSQKENELTQAISKTKEEYEKTVLSNREEIARLKQLLENNQKEKENAVEVALSKKETEIAELKMQLKASGNEMSLKVKEAEEKLNKEISKQKEEIINLQNKLDNQKTESQLKEQSLVKNYEETIKLKDEMIERQKDLKMKLSNKLVGETLEQHCEIEFNKLRASGFQNAYFEKDNEVKEGTKGDYIFRDFEEGNEYISIMFEMKNEMEGSTTKHKNEDFLEKLHKDREKKKCEYAILVSMLEPENELYNSGIVDMSHKYPKMYVVRPQFFIPIITLLRNANRSQLYYRNQLMVVQNQNIDISNFETELNDFKEKFGKNSRLANERFLKAISEIDKAIEQLEKTKDDLLMSNKQLKYANDKLDDLTIKKLTKNNQTMKAKFEEAGYKE